MATDKTGDASGAPSKKPEQSPKRYEKPELVEYGDIARLTETGGPSTRDGTGQRKRTG